MRMFVKLAIAAAAFLAVLQLIRPNIRSGPMTAEITVPPHVRQILEKDCYSCHSNERKLAWFDQIVPGYWLVRHDVLTAREHLNFSTLGTKPEAAQRATLYEAVNMIQLGAMPLPQFTALHPDAKVTPEELAELKAYLAPWKNVGSLAAAPGADAAAGPANLAAVPAEFNGLQFQPQFETWKPISFTDRGDNNTFRAILGNDIAVKAAEAGNISPWPDGTRFGKIAWQQAAGEDGLIHPGEFVQVEFMVKDATHYRASDGWGWGRWRGSDLKPYGTNSQFVAECTGCHEPVRGDDFVYTLPITSAKSSGNEVANNRAAALPQSLPYQPLNWNVITMFVDPKDHTMATLFGNDEAMQAVKGGRTKKGFVPAYPAGSVLALLTWNQREDPHWFGARVPDNPQSIEFVETDASGNGRAYQCYAGPLLKEHIVPIEEGKKRSGILLNLVPATLP
jgi:Haem-binding domain/Cytochrome P460